MQRIQQARNELNEQRHQLEMQWQELEHQRDQIRQQSPLHKPMWKMERFKPFCFVVMVMCLIVHVLAAVWVFQDIRIRGTGSGIWIVIALIAGLPGALVYAVVRLGDMKQSQAA